MERYWLFTWDTYYPLGGTDQVKLTFTTIEEFINWYANTQYVDEWAELIDMKIGNTYRSERMTSKEDLKSWIESLFLEIW
ncbi:hypothetical protein [Cytobacillus praedii]|uniref:Uncharacterized protein n=1 Tax=Cytobacillus praedii TaxID=1742358 RepID=A0A4R1AMY4_9BACI|nr:hypothetical protein [Cytobacillus praedii]TCJ01148.1 hypothetical protein E0Y62_25540 [Cytobacillus praedii]